QARLRGIDVNAGRGRGGRAGLVGDQREGGVLDVVEVQFAGGVRAAAGGDGDAGDQVGRLADEGNPLAVAADRGNQAHAAGGRGRRAGLVADQGRRAGGLVVEEDVAGFVGIGLAGDEVGGVAEVDDVASVVADRADVGGDAGAVGRGRA